MFHSSTQETRRLKWRLNQSGAGGVRIGQQYATESATLSGGSRPRLRLSEAAAAWLQQAELEDGNRATLADKRTALWYVSRNSPGQRLHWRHAGGLLCAWVEWLRSTPQAPRKPWSMPRALTPESVRRFLLYPPARRLSDRPRSEQRIGHYWHSVRGFLAGLGLDTRLPRKQHRAGSAAATIRRGWPCRRRWWPRGARCWAGGRPRSIPRTASLRGRSGGGWCGCRRCCFSRACGSGNVWRPCTAIRRVATCCWIRGA